MWYLFSFNKFYSILLNLGLIPIAIENKLQGDGVNCDLDLLNAAITKYDTEILCILSNTSAFAPRIPDKYFYFIYFIYILFNFILL